MPVRGGSRQPVPDRSRALGISGSCVTGCRSAPDLTRRSASAAQSADGCRLALRPPARRRGDGSANAPGLPRCRKLGAVPGTRRRYPSRRGPGMRRCGFPAGAVGAHRVAGPRRAFGRVPARVPDRGHCLPAGAARADGRRNRDRLGRAVIAAFGPATVREQAGNALTAAICPAGTSARRVKRAPFGGAAVNARARAGVDLSAPSRAEPARPRQREKRQARRKPGIAARQGKGRMNAAPRQSGRAAQRTRQMPGWHDAR